MPSTDLPDHVDRDDDLDRGLAVAAHELRGPLLGARAALEHVLTDEALPAADAGLLRRTEQELTKLSDKVEALLLWGAGTIQPVQIRMDLVRITRDAIDTCSLGYEPDRVSLRAPDRLEIIGDPLHLRTAVENVVRNALAYSSPDSIVDVVVTRIAEEGAEISVRDRGPGLSPTALQAALDPFGPRDPQDERSGGHGFGLFITQRVIVAHGGEVACGPPRDGGGTVLRLRFPDASHVALTPFPGGGHME